MSRNATASWSGYSHQGKIGLLVALRKINSLHGTGAVLSDYFLQYEIYEDASISHNNVVLEVHQVKAKNGDTTKGSYTRALSLFTADGTDKYLHTTCEITNWNELTGAENPRGVSRYIYRAGFNYCPLTSIGGYIDEEIAALLRNADHLQLENQAFRESCFQEFLAILDERVRLEHAFHEEADYDVRFTLAEVYSIFITAPTQTDARRCAIRKALYETYLQFLVDLDENRIQISEEHETLVGNAIVAIYRLSNEKFEQFLRNINPHTTGGQRLEQNLTTDKFFVSDSFYGVFLNTLINVTNCQYNLDAKDIPNYHKDVGYLITSIASPLIRLAQHARNILENGDIDFSAYENDYIITEQYEGYLHEHANKVVTRVPASDKFMQKKEMQFITVPNAILTLNN